MNFIQTLITLTDLGNVLAVDLKTVKISKIFLDFRNYKQCAASCMAQFDTCTAFEFGNNICTLGSPDSLLQVCKLRLGKWSKAKTLNYLIQILIIPGASFLKRVLGTVIFKFQN